MGTIFISYAHEDLEAATRLYSELKKLDADPWFCMPHTADTDYILFFALLVRDRLEPEPKALVLQVFILGGLLASAIGIPFLEGFFEISTWLYRNTWSHLLGAILVIGVSQEFLKYAAVRFSVFGSAEFDEPIDGIVYATASGLGFATVLNIAFVVNSGGVDLGAGVIRMTVIALAHASFAGVVGYYLGLEKFEKRPVWSTAVGLALAALLNGIFFFLRNTITQGSINASGGYAQSWNGLILAAILAAIITWGLSVALKKHASAELAAEEG